MTMDEMDEVAYKILNAVDETSKSEQVYIMATAYGILMARVAKYNPETVCDTLNAMKEAVMLGAVMEIKKQRGEWKQ